MKTIDNLNFKNLRALVRVDFNVPLNKKMQITDDTRMRAAIPTIKKILSDGGSVVLMSHRGRPDGNNPTFSLKNLTPTLSQMLSTKVLFAEDCINEKTKLTAKKLKPGQVLMLENIRYYKEEVEGCVAFAKELSSLGDVYVNDAFGTAHRPHASTTIIAQFFKEKKFFGYLMANEIKNINKLLKNTNNPFTAIIGGAKVSSKITIISQLLNKVDNLIIGGGMAFTFIKALGGNVGNSLVEEDKIGLALKIIKTAKEKNVRLYIPTDSVNADQFNNEAKVQNSLIEDVQDGFMGLDIGPETANTFSDIIAGSATILWNGPMGVFEMENFSAGTKSVALALAKATEKGAFTLVGGGDSVAAINKYNLAKKVSYVSTGGGAMLEYIEGKLLPGVAAIME